MDKKELSKLTNQELLEKAKEIRPTSVVDATLIGILIGIVIYSVVQNSWGLVTLVPLFLVYTLYKKSKRNKELEKLMKERNLK
jgi:F0F1-type ATP synthase assembly protein I